MMENTRCRFCGKELKSTFADLGLSPLTNEYITQENLNKVQYFYPLHVMVCEECFLVQAIDYEVPENIFSEYNYFSSYSNSWLAHIKSYVDFIVEELKLNCESQVIEIASNDGYLLQFFKSYNIRTIGIEPAKNVAKEAEKKGIYTIVDFFGEKLAIKLKEKNIQADLLIGNNVVAHVPDINDFIAGAKIILNAEGIITMEFPHLLNLITKNQFDTIYHEHFSYFSLMTINHIFKSKGLKIFDVQEIPTHGGSLRIFATNAENIKREVSSNIGKIINKELELGLNEIDIYTNFNQRIQQIKKDILQFLISLKDQGNQIVGYGAAAKGNTLLNYCGIGKDFIDYVVDISPHKQGKYLPGTRIPIQSIDRIKETKPNYIIILPWNIKQEIIELLKFAGEWKAKIVLLIPKIEIIDL